MNMSKSVCQERECFIPLHTDGILSQSDLVKDCHRNRWIPVLAFRPKEDRNARPTIPFLLGAEDCRKWCNRHLPKTWTKGYYSLKENEFRQACEDNGWDCQMYPSYKRIPADVEMSPEVLYIEHEEPIDIIGSIGNRFYIFNK